MLGDQVADDLDLLLAAAMLGRADVLAGDLAVGLGLGLHAAVAGLIEERVVQVLWHQREGEAVGRLTARRREGRERATPAAAHMRSFFIDC